MKEEGGPAEEEEEGSDRFISTAERLLAPVRLSAWIWRGRCRSEGNKGEYKPRAGGAKETWMPWR